MLQTKVYICYKTLSNRIRIQKNAFKNQKPYLIARGDHRKTNDVTKVLLLKCAPATGIVKEIVMAHNNIC